MNIFTNLHFLSFLADVMLWLIAGYAIGQVVNTVEDVPNRKRLKNTLLFTIAAFHIGCWAVVTRGLPDVGISFYSVMYVLVVTSAIAYGISSQLRTIVRDSGYVKELQNMVQNVRGQIANYVG